MTVTLESPLILDGYAQWKGGIFHTNVVLAVRSLQVRPSTCLYGQLGFGFLMIMSRRNFKSVYPGRRPVRL